MQSFDQSLMMLVRQNLITYPEALRQASNPDDFALRFQGVSSTSDSKWDDFDHKPGDEKQVPGTVGFGQQQQPPPASPTGSAARPAVSSGRSGVQPAAQPTAGSGSKPAAPKPSADDDFQIERF
jgi:twitching motility protein PilT